LLSAKSEKKKLLALGCGGCADVASALPPEKLSAGADFRKNNLKNLSFR